MRILVVGASGRLGSAVVDALADRHEIVTASRSGDGHFVDLRNPATIAGLYASVGPVDAVACTAGKTPYGALEELGSDQFAEGVRDKLLGQIELVRQGARHLPDGGSFTLVSGVLGVDPIRTGAVASTVNGGIDSFVRAAAIELPRGLRVNAVSATVFAEAWDVYGPLFPGFKPVPVADAARAFVKSIEGALTGKVFRVGY
jgi:NAD(P)-dependent dehydrogenase (short-subunit alcohol dehydrogenase family)